MKVKIGLVLGLALLASLAYVWLQQRKEAAYAAATPYERGWMLIADRGCTACHQADNGFRAPVLKGLIGQTVKLADGRTVLADAAYVRRSLLEPKSEVSAGYQPVMPSYAGSLTDEQIESIVSALGAP